MLKVLHFVHWPRSGITSLLKSMIPLFASNQFKHYYLLLEGEPEDTEEFREITTQTYSISPDCGFLKRLKSVRRTIKDIKPDIIHTHSFQPSLWTSLFSGEAAIVRTIHCDYPYFHAANIGSRIKRTVEGACLVASKGFVISVSDGVEANLPWKLAKKQLLTIPNGIDIEYLQTRGNRLSKEKAFNTLNTTFTFSSMGRLENEKGYDVLIEAVALLRQSCREDFCLVLIGEGSERETLENLINRYSLQNHVKLLGYNPNPHDLLYLSDCYVSSSRYEGFGLSLTEAMALGLPLITTEVSSVTELLTDRVHAYKLDTLTPGSLSIAMLYLMQNADVRNKISKAGAKLVEENFNIKGTIEKYSGIYHKLAGGEG